MSTLAFPKLEKIDWSKKRLLRGSPTDLPTWIRALASDSESDRVHAAQQLRTGLLVEGRYQPVSGDVAEVLMDGLGAEGLPDPALVLRLAVDLATDDHTQHLDARFRSASVGKGGQKKAYQALAKQSRALIDRLTHGPSSLRAAAAFALGFLGDEKGVLAALHARIDAESDPHVLGALSIAVGMASDERPALDRFLDAAEPAVRCAAAIGIALHDHAPTEPVARALGEALLHSFEEIPWANGRLRGYVSSQLWNRDARYATALAPFVVAHYLAFAPADDDPELLAFTNAALLVTFPDRHARKANPFTSEELSDLQRQVLTKVRELEADTAMLTELGLPALGSLGLLLDEPTRLHRPITLDVGGTAATMPLWRALDLSATVEPSDFVQAFLEAFPAGERHDALAEACAAIGKVRALKSPVVCGILDAAADEMAAPAAALRDELIQRDGYFPPQLSLIALWPMVVREETIDVSLSRLAGSLKGIGDAKAFLPRVAACMTQDALLASGIERLR